MWSSPPPLLNFRRCSVSLICTPQVSGYEAVGRKRDHGSLWQHEGDFLNQKATVVLCYHPSTAWDSRTPHTFGDWHVEGVVCWYQQVFKQLRLGTCYFSLAWPERETPSTMENPEHTSSGRQEVTAYSSRRFSDQPGLLKRSSCCFPAGTGLNYSADRPAVLHWSWCLGNVFKAAALLGKWVRSIIIERENFSSNLSRAQEEALGTMTKLTWWIISYLRTVQGYG